MKRYFFKENLAFLRFSLLLSEVSLPFFRKPRFFGKKKARIGGSGKTKQCCIAIQGCDGTPLAIYDFEL